MKNWAKAYSSMIEKNILRPSGQKPLIGTRAWVVAGFLCSILAIVGVIASLLSRLEVTRWNFAFSARMLALLGLVIGIMGIASTKGRLNRKARGFSIAAIILCLISIFSPPVLTRTGIMEPLPERPSAPAEECIKNLKQLGLACYFYAQENDNDYPDNLEALYPNIIHSKEPFLCPAARHKRSEIDPESPEVKVIDYEYIKGLKFTDQHDLVLAYDKKPWHEGGRNVLFNDGHVEPMEEDRFQIALEKTKKYLQTRGKH